MDHFKDWNNKLGEGGGDEIIKKFAVLLEGASTAKAVLLHEGGDEFPILMPRASPEEAILLAYKIARELNLADFAHHPELGKLTTSAGIVTTESEFEQLNFEHMRDRSNRIALKQEAKTKRNTARLPPDYQSVTQDFDPMFKADLAFCLAKSSLDSRSPFANVWLNCLSMIVCEELTSDIIQNGKLSVITNEFLKWAALDVQFSSVNRSAIAREYGLDGTPSVSLIDCAFAVAHGILRHELLFGREILKDLELQLEHSDDLKKAVLRAGDLILWSLGEEKSTLEIYDLGRAWTVEQNVDPVPRVTRAIIIQIGHEQLRLPTSIFSEKITVDDRPTRDGGLPDFWEATIARLISATLRNRNVRAVYVLPGDSEYALQTISRLKTIDKWQEQAFEMESKIGIKVPDILEAGKFLAGKIYFPKKEQELISSLALLLRAGDTIKPASQKYPAMEGFMVRKFEINDMALHDYDGFTAETVAKAFPVVLEILRQAPIDPVDDQTGVKNRELIDFKVHITNPRKDSIPSFYSSDKDLFNYYFKQQFLDPSGIFGKRIQQDGQLDAVLNHLKMAVQNPKHRFATRRAVIIIPHAILNGEPDPIGLISIRCIPRFQGSKVVLHYSYAWRTVEALVGFPYSIYGSVMYSEHLTEKLREKLPLDRRNTLSFGEIYYIAHSLHLFQDDYGQKIAKRIVDDASK